MGALGGVRPGGAFLGFEKGQSIMSGREGWGLSVKPSLAPSSSLRQGKGRRYLLLGLSWAQALGVWGPQPGALGPQGSCDRSGTTRGEKPVVCKKGDQCKFLHQNDVARMPKCHFSFKSGGRCPFLHCPPSRGRGRKFGKGPQRRSRASQVAGQATLLLQPLYKNRTCLLSPAPLPCQAQAHEARPPHPRPAPGKGRVGRESKAELLPCTVRLITQPDGLSGKEAVSGAPGSVGASVSQTARTFTVGLDAPAPSPPLSTILLFFASFRRKLYIASLNGKLASLIGGFSPSSVSKESPCSAGDPGSFPGSGRSSGEGNGNPLQYWKIPRMDEPGRLQFMG